MIELTVAGLSVDPVSKSPILVLRTKSGLFILPVWIGPGEAVSISLALQKLEVPRPLTHDLLLSTIKALDYSLKSVQIVRVEDGVFFAQLELAQGSKTVLVDCRPSDAVAAALRVGAPMYASREVIDEAGIEYPAGIQHTVPVSGGDGAIAMMLPDDEPSGLTNSDDELGSADSDLLVYMDPESKYKM
ncbi:MAG: bifunctional nuclease family protein [Desulfovibrionaceae bacterium]|nr:bifunctional nuclease family protein [Desulfovibrionaceae bacterium]